MTSSINRTRTLMYFQYHIRSAGPSKQHLSTLSYRPVDLPERRLRRDTISSVQSVPLAWNRTAPVDDQLPPRRSPQRRFIVLPVLRQFFHTFFVITSASRSDRDLSLFSFSFAPYPVLRSLRLSLTGWYRDHSLFTCLVLFPFVPLYGREPSHTDHHPSFTENQPYIVGYRHTSA